MDTTQNKPKTRLFEITILNVLFCLLVVFIHVSGGAVAELDKNSWQYILLLAPWRLSGFVVQGFIFLSGLKLFLNKSKKITYGRFYIGRLRQIILPYILWVLIYYIYFCSKDYFVFDIFDFFKYILAGDLSGHFYFVVVIAQFYLLTPLWMYLVKKNDKVVLITISLMLTIILGQSLHDILQFSFNGFDYQYMDRTFTSYLIYWIAGCYAGLHYENFKEMLIKNRLFITIFFIITAVANTVLSYYTLSGKYVVYWLENLSVLYCICTILFTYTSAVYLSRKFTPAQGRVKAAVFTLVKGIDKISYEIYLSHCLVLFAVNDLLSKFAGLSVFTKFTVRTAVTYIFTIGSLLLWSAVKTRFSQRKAKNQATASDSVNL